MRKAGKTDGRRAGGRSRGFSGGAEPRHARARVLPEQTERSLMFAYVRLKSLMFAYFEKKYFFPALWPAGARTPWIAAVMRSGRKIEARGGDGTFYPSVEDTGGQGGVGVRPTERSLSGRGPGFPLGRRLFANMKTVVVLIAEGHYLIHCGAELCHDGSEQQCNGTHVNRCLMHASEEASEMPSVKIRDFRRLTPNSVQELKNVCLILRQKMTQKREIRRWERACGLLSPAKRALIPCLSEVNRTPHLVERARHSCGQPLCPRKISV